MSWEKIRMGDFLKNRDLRFKPKDPDILSLKRIEKIDFSGNIYISDKPSNTDMILVKKGDLVISGINVEKGAMAIYNGEDDITATIHYSSYEFDTAKIDLDFLKNYLKSKKFTEALKDQVPGGIKTEIKPKHILPLEVEIPTNIEKQKIIIKDFENRNKKVGSIDFEHTHQLDLLKKLRQQILQDAVHGKLVPQDSNEEPASKLLERIKEEKEQLIREKKIKKDKPLPEIKPEEIPFEIPENWVWCRLGDICTKIGSGSTPRGSNYSNQGVPFFRSQNIHDNGLDYNDIKFINNEVQKQMSGTIVEQLDLLLNITGGSLGRCAIVPENFTEGNVSQHVCIIRPISQNNNLYHNVVLSPYFQKLIFKSTTGAGREGLPKYNLQKFIVPIPPFQEQYRIVSKIEQLINICDELEQSIQQNQKYTQELLHVALKEALEPASK